MKLRRSISLIALLLLVIVAGPMVYARYVGTHKILSAAEVSCEKCHGDVYAEVSASTVGFHSGAKCTDCHTWPAGHFHAYTLPINPDTGEPDSKELCYACGHHTTEMTEWPTGSHAMVECYFCHSESTWPPTERTAA